MKLLLVSLMVLVSVLAWAGCCEDYCTDATECQGVFHDEDCDLIPACELGCCVDEVYFNHSSYPKVLCEKKGGLFDSTCEYEELCSFDTCLDGTPVDKCSVNMPMICQKGIVVENCSECGCPDEYECLLDGRCNRLTTAYQLIAVPVNWPNDSMRALYETFVEDASNFFRQSTRFASCPDELEVVILNENCDVGPLCTNPGTPSVNSADGVITKIKNCIEDAGYFDYDVFVGVADVCSECPTDVGTCIDGWSLKLGDCQGTLDGVLTGITDITIFSHELGHVYGTCDEYDSGVWFYQDQICGDVGLSCPNPFIENPVGCSLSTGNLCYGKEVTPGHFSVMGSGPVSNDRYTEECKDMINSKLPTC